MRIFSPHSLRLLLACLIVGLGGTACQKDSDVLDTFRTADTGLDALTAFETKNGAPAQLFTVASLPYTCTTAQGTQITIPADAFIVPAGTVVGSNPVRLEVRELFDKPTLLLSGISTAMDAQPLDMGAVLHLKAIQGNTALRLNPAALLRIRAGVSQMPAFYGPQLFYGRRTNGVFGWQAQAAGDTRSTVRRDSVPGQPAFYQLTLNNDTLGWVSCARRLPVSNPVTVEVSVSGQDVQPTNTAVYLTLAGYNTVLRGTRQTSGLFTVPNVPPGTEATAVVIRYVDGNYHYGQQLLRVSAASRSAAPPMVMTNEAIVVAALKRLQ